MMYKRISRLMIVVFFTIAVFLPNLLTVYAATANVNVDLKCSNDSVRIGETFTVDVVLSTFTNIADGIACFGPLDVSFDDSKFQVVEITAKNEVHPIELKSNIVGSNVVRLIYVDSTAGTTPIVNEGTVCSISFKVRDQARIENADFNIKSVVGFADASFKTIKPVYGTPASVTITISPPVTLTDYKVTGTTITNINACSTITSFLNRITISSNTTLKFISANGTTILDGNSFVGTGTTIEVLVNGVKTNTYTMVIYGDVNGDGVTNLNDLVSIRNELMEMPTLSGVFKQAGDIYGEDSITLNDLVGIMSDISESGNINQNR